MAGRGICSRGRFLVLTGNWPMMRDDAFTLTQFVLESCRFRILAVLAAVIR